MPPLPATILIVEDEEDIRHLITRTLVSAGFRSLEAGNGQDGFVLALEQSPDLILVDWMMPVVNGIELIRRLRRDARTRDIPLIVLSAKSEVDHKAEGLDSGADDYVTKPFSPKELLARIRACLRRSQDGQQQQTLSVDALRLDIASHMVTVDNNPVHLGPTEFRLLEFLMGHPNRVYTRAQLLDHVWGSNVYVDERTVDVHIRRLRKALENKNCNRLIQTVHGVGYRFSDTMSAESNTSG